MIVIGIDIGLNGAICVLSNDSAHMCTYNDECIIETCSQNFLTYHLYDMPITHIKDKKRYKTIIDKNKLVSILDNYNPDIIVFENINSIFGVKKSTMLSLGKQIGYIELYATIKDIKYKEIAPKEWQKSIYKHFNIDTKTVDTISGYDKRYKDTFYLSFKALEHIISNDVIEKHFRKKNNNKYKDGRIDAFLIAFNELMKI